jgi:hypothetical protein
LKFGEENEHDLHRITTKSNSQKSKDVAQKIKKPQAWCHIPRNWTLGWQKQEDHGFEAGLGYITRTCLKIKKAKIELLYDLAIPLLNIYSKEIKSICQKLYSTFIAALQYNVKI